MSDYATQPHDVDLAGKRFAIIVSTYHDSVTENLLQGARQTLLDHGATAEAIDVLRVPGAWELALGSKVAAETGAYQGLISLGAVVRGETTHDQYINRFVSDALGQLSLQHNLPLGFGLLTCNTLEQAMARSGGAVGNKGNEAALAMIGMVGFLETLLPTDRR